MRGTVGTGVALVLGVLLAGCTPGGGAAPSPGPAVEGADPVASAEPSDGSATPAPVVVTGDLTWPDLGGVEADAVTTGYASTIEPISADLAARMATSWREGCPVPLADLRHVTATYRTFEGGVATGELVVHADVADGVVAVLGELFALGYPIRSMRLVDDFGGSDDASMAADNTSAFNCRPISRGTGWSEHAYGRAIDLNPRENPYVRGTLVLPPEGAPYASRPDEPGVVHAGDAVVQAFAAHGWAWGGDWSSPVDYQHFSTTGR